MYTNALYRVNDLFVPHPFLAFSKCKNDENIKSNNEIISKPIELIYVLLPFDDLDNLKPYELYNWIHQNKIGVNFDVQTEAINKFKINNTLNNMNGGYLCDIKFKTNTYVYTKKVDSIIKIYGLIIKKNIIIDNYIFKDDIDSNIRIVIDNNINKFKKLNQSYENYNSKYDFNGIKYIKTKSDNTLNNELKFDYSNNISNFIKKYILTDGKCEDELYLVKNNDLIHLKNKYLKYKYKYIRLKQQHNKYI